MCDSVSIIGSGRLLASGTVHELEADLRAGVPLIGGRIEKAGAEPLTAAADIETRLLHQRLG